MKHRKWLAIFLAGGLCFSLSSCVSDLALYSASSISTYLPDVIESLVDSLTDTE